MNADQISSQLKYLACNGVTLNPSELMNVKLGLEELQCLVGFEELKFWGKIEGKWRSVTECSNLLGCLTDYFIATGISYLGHTGFCKKEFFWCSGENYKFSKLPDPLTGCKAVFDHIQTSFTGEFDKVVVSAHGVSEQAFIPKEVLATTPIPMRGLTELDRLSFVVQQIEHDCQIVPKGALKMTPLNELRKNEAFRGLKLDQASKVENYYHFRAPVLKKNVELNQMREGVYNNDFLDNASEDLPAHHWSVHKDTLGSLAVLRSKLWAGFYAYHKVNSSIFGALYVGTGCKNRDAPF